MSPGSGGEEEYYRTPARLTVHYGPDDPRTRRFLAMENELWQTQSILESAARMALDELDEESALAPVMAVLRWLDFKMDMMLYFLRAEEIEKYFPHTLESTDISGGGVGVRGPAPEPGSRLLMNFCLPDSPARPVFSGGEVIPPEADQAQRGAGAAVRFTDLAEADRERIIRYTFARQRRELSRRAAKEHA